MKVIFCVFSFQNATKVESIQALNLERQATVRDFCRRKNRNDEAVNIKKLSNIIVAEKLKILFCYIPKVSCTQWKTVIASLDGAKTKTWIHNPKNFKFLHVYPRNDVDRMLKTYFKFVFVREPLERLLSAYLDKFHSGDSAFHSAYGRGIIRRYRPGGNPEHKNVTFDEFLNFVINIGNSYWNEHWQTYDKLCHPCAIQYDFIGRFENLEEEASFVLSGIKRKSNISFPHVRPSSTPSKLSLYYSQISRERLDRLLQIFSGDSEMFGYDLPRSVRVS